MNKVFVILRNMDTVTSVMNILMKDYAQALNNDKIVEKLVGSRAPTKMLMESSSTQCWKKREVFCTKKLSAIYP